ncbi:uncharacterized protein LOC121416525 [Lytechinus variegatus]|uniref:uncharacterized protein LOC121416525 n=1 Tax=Lytechinus variegatus TaxID=7654 RepID=UPI001BB12101|nr:uncharacterized protein LOC121416525 [Lytechinus variegatus]
MMSSKLVFIAIATVALIDRGNCLSCVCHEFGVNTPALKDWRDENCPVDVQCPAGSKVLWDICSCCKSDCSKLEGEDCGGVFDEAGRCGDGLACYVEPSAEPDYYMHEYRFGKCVPKNPTVSTPFNDVTTVPSTAAGGAVTKKSRRGYGCGKKKMARMGEEDRKRCEKEREMRKQKRREGNRQTITSNIS